MPVSYTFTPPVQPDFGLKREVKPKILRADFGDGYSQRAADGYNNQTVDLSLTWTNLLPSEKDAILNFFIARRGYQSFYFTYIDEPAAKVYICESWTNTHDDAGVYTVTAEFKQVWDI